MCKTGYYFPNASGVQGVSHLLGSDTLQLQTSFDDESKVHRYFKKFRTVSEALYSRLGKVQGVAHTDLIKCSSNNWPPEGVSSSGRKQIIKNCTNKYLQQQLRDCKIINWLFIVYVLTLVHGQSIRNTRTFSSP